MARRMRQQYIFFSTELPTFTQKNKKKKKEI